MSTVKSIRDFSNGFTLVEVLVVGGIIAVLLALGSSNILNFQRRSHLRTTTSTFIADLNRQRFRAMSGDTQGRSTIDSYGVYLGTNTYVLFHGTTYSAGNSDNVTIPFESPVTLQSTTFPGSTVIFTKGSGEISGFNPAQNTITLLNTSSNETLTITLNQYGTITSGSQ